MCVYGFAYVDSVVDKFFLLVAVRRNDVELPFRTSLRETERFAANLCDLREIRNVE